MKRIEKDGKFYRMRNNQLVEIPETWVGNVTHPQTIRKRQSKEIRKIKKYIKCLNKGKLFKSRNNENIYYRFMEEE